MNLTMPKKKPADKRLTVVAEANPEGRHGRMYRVSGVLAAYGLDNEVFVAEEAGKQNAIFVPAHANDGRAFLLVQWPGSIAEQRSINLYIGRCVRSMQLQGFLPPRPAAPPAGKAVP